MMMVMVMMSYKDQSDLQVPMAVRMMMWQVDAAQMVLLAVAEQGGCYGLSAFVMMVVE